MDNKKVFEDKLNSKLDALEVLKAINYRTDTITTHNHTIRCFCPLHKETVFRTLTVNSQKKTYKCGFTSCEGFVEHDLLELYAKALKISRDDSIRFWAEKLGMLAELPAETETAEPPDKKTEKGMPKPQEETKGKPLSSAPAAPAKSAIKAKPSKISEEELQNKILKLINEKKTSEAVSQLNQLLLLNSKNLWGKEVLGKILLEKGDITKAGPLLEEVAFSGIENNELSKAIELFQLLINKKPDNTKWRNPLINLYLQMNRQDDALAELNCLAEVLIKQKKHQDLLEVYDKINTLQPDNIDNKKNLISLCLQINQTIKALLYTLELSDIFLKNKQADAAIELLNETLKTAPGNTDIRKKLIDILLAQGKTSQAITEMEALAVEYLKLKDTSSAAQIYKDIFKLDTHNLNALKALTDIYGKSESAAELAEIHFQMASVLLADRKVKAAIEILEKLLQNQPNNEEILRTLVGCYLQEKKTDKAVACLLQLSDLYRDKKDLENSLKCSMDILEFEPDSIPAHERLVEIYHKSKKLDQAVFHLTRMAEIYLKSGKNSQAKKAVNLALKFPVRKLASLNILAEIYRREKSLPRFLAVLRTLAREYLRQQKIDEAQKILDQAFTMKADSPSLLLLQAAIYQSEEKNNAYIATLEKACKLYDKSGYHRKCLKLLQDAWVMNPENDTIFENLIQVMVKSGEKDKASEFLMRRARDHVKLNRLDEARKELAQIMEFVPDHQEALNMLAGILLETGNIEESAALYLKLANIYLDKEKVKEAGTIGQKLLKSNPRMIEAHQVMARVFRQMEKPDKAIKHLMFIGKLLFDNNEIDKTIAHYRECIEEYPEHLEFYQVLIELYKAQKRIPEALSASQMLSSQLFALNKLDELISLYQSMVLMEPENLETRTALAECYTKSGLIHDALMEYDVISGKYLLRKDFQKVKQIYGKMQELAPEMEEIKEAYTRLEALSRQ
jgi:tetratricopeptide (TPR) repeat protein